MKHIMTLAALCVAAGCTAQSAEEEARMEANSEARLAAALEGFEQAGPPVDCVRSAELAGNRAGGEGAIIFDGRAPGTLWVNRPPGGCPDFGLGRTLVIRTTATQLCRGDIATVSDLQSGAQYGGCGLGEFTPYRRVRD